MTKLAVVLASTLAVGALSTQPASAYTLHRPVVHSVKEYTCKDGTTSKTKKGCKKHGGVQKKAKK